MSNKNNITILALRAGIAALLAKAQTENKVEIIDLESFQGDLQAFATQLAAEQQQTVVIIGDLKDQILARDASYHELQEEMAELQKQTITVVNDLKQQLKGAIQKTAQASAKLTVDIDGVTYKVMHGAYPHSAREISEKPAVAKELLAIDGQQVLIEV